NSTRYIPLAFGQLHPDQRLHRRSHIAPPQSDNPTASMGDYCAAVLSARIRGAGGMAAISGSAGGAGFVLQTGGGAQADEAAEGAATEQAATDEAAMQALAACAKGF
ncbi:MAG TPA: hypothetical protein VM325_03335, partial [Alphaproteobacteria bacterium]|nr:hypothetical protein [Alphaproteobacteria bacterium]